MAKLFSILLMTVIGISMFGVYPVLKLMQWRAENSMRENLKQHLPDEELSVFVDAYKNKDIKWEEADKEFSYKGEMYDVVHVKQGSGRPVYYCLSDKKETEICTLINKVISRDGNNSLTHTNTTKLVKLFIQVFTPSERYYHVPSLQGDDLLRMNNYRSCYYSVCFIQVNNPPPEYI